MPLNSSKNTKVQKNKAKQAHLFYEYYILRNYYVIFFNRILMFDVSVINLYISRIIISYLLRKNNFE